MQLFQEILAQAINDGKLQIVFQCGEQTVSEITERICYQTLAKIKAIIQDDSLSDPECFAKIEEIVCALEEIGVHCGSRHDFG